MSYLLLEDYNDGCEGSDLDCYPNSGAFLLRQFFFEYINPYLHIVVSALLQLLGNSVYIYIYIDTQLSDSVWRLQLTAAIITEGVHFQSL